METNPSNHTNPIPYVVTEQRIKNQVRKVDRAEQDIIRTQRSVNNLRKQKHIHELVMQLLANANFYNKAQVKQGLIIDTQV